MLARIWHRIASAPAGFAKLPILSCDFDSCAATDGEHSLKDTPTQAVIRENIDNSLGVLHVLAAHLLLLITQLLEHSRLLFEVSHHQGQCCGCGVMPSKEEIESHILHIARQPSDFIKKHLIGIKFNAVQTK